MKLGGKGLTGKAAQKAIEKTAAKVGTGAAVGAGAIMQGSDAGVSAYDQLMELPDELWDMHLGPDYVSLPYEERQKAKHEKAMSLSRNAATASGIASVGLNMMPGARNLERMLAGAKLPGSKSRLAHGMTGFFGEGLQEAGEEGFGVISSNLAIGEVDPNQDAFEGAGEAAGLGAAGGIFGGVAGVVAGRDAPRETSKSLDEISKTIAKAPELDSMLAESDAIIDDALDMPTNPAMRQAMDSALAEAGVDETLRPKALDKGGIPLSQLTVVKESTSPDGEIEEWAVPADAAMADIDDRIDQMKILIKCVGYENK
jgi:hypothetical protein